MLLLSFVLLLLVLPSKDCHYHSHDYLASIFGWGKNFVKYIFQQRPNCRQFLKVFYSWNSKKWVRILFMSFCNVSKIIINASLGVKRPPNTLFLQGILQCIFRSITKIFKTNLDLGFFANFGLDTNWIKINYTSSKGFVYIREVANTTYPCLATNLM